MTFPTARVTPFDPPPALAQIRTAHGPLCRLSYPDGHQGWLVTGDKLARAVLADPRFSARSEFKRVPVPRPGAAPFIGKPALPGWFVDMDRPDHTRLRRLIGNRLTMRRVETLAPRIEQIADECLNDMRRKGSPADLVAEFALPVPSKVICELLGVPHAAHDRFQHHSEVLFDLSVSAAAADASMAALDALLHETIERRRAEPADDLIGYLIASGEVSDDEIAGAAVLLLTAGHETVAGMLGLGVYVLLSEPQALEDLRRGRMEIGGAVEELLRYLTIFHLGVPRTAMEPVELDGIHVAPGEAVTVALAAANRDPARFTHPDRFEVRPGAPGHLAFGHGIHQCVGQNLARLELRIALTRVLTGLPGLRLAVDPGSITLGNAGFHRVEKLPVAW